MQATTEAVFLTKFELAQRWGVDIRTIDRRVKESGFPKPLKIGRLLRFKLEAIIAWENASMQ